MKNKKGHFITESGHVKKKTLENFEFKYIDSEDFKDYR